ncbi:MAG TPA: hypothetical protein VF331_16090 [Polyangiales bacterium]
MPKQVLQTCEASLQLALRHWLSPAQPLPSGFLARQACAEPSQYSSDIQLLSAAQPSTAVPQTPAVEQTPVRHTLLAFVLLRAPSPSDLTVVPNAAKPNRIVAHIPGIDASTSQPTFAAGKYKIRVTSTHECASTLDGDLSVTATLDGTLLTSIAPSFVSPTKPTAVTVAGAGFLTVPRLYLTPASGTGTAVALRSVEVAG